MAAEGKHAVDCTLKPVFDHFLKDERDRRKEEHEHRETLYEKVSDLDRRVTKVETKIAIYILLGSLGFNVFIKLIEKVM